MNAYLWLAIGICAVGLLTMVVLANAGARRQLRYCTRHRRLYVTTCPWCLDERIPEHIPVFNFPKRN